MPALDDRGNPISALRPRDIRRAADAEDPSRALLARHLRQAIRVESQRLSWRRLVWVFAAVVAWICLQIFVYHLDVRDIPGLRAVAFFGGIAIIGLVGRELTRRRVSRLVAATAVAEGVCGQCCYSLGGVPTEPDGCVTCPECGAAWSAARITRPHWVGDSLPSSFHDDVPPLKERIARAIHRFFTGTPKPSTLICADDRERFVRTVDSRFILVPRSRRVELTRVRVSNLRRSTRRKGRIPRVLCSLPSAVGGILCGVATVGVLVDEPGEVAGAIAAAIGGLFFCAVTAAVFLSHLFLPPIHTARVLVADGLCGSCTTELNEPADPQGLCTCSRCGSTWRIPRFTALQCVHCGYDLHGLPSTSISRCPECGGTTLSSRPQT